MSEFFYEPISRKQFLKVSAGILGGLVASWDPQASGGEAIENTHACPLRLALLSDTHVAADPTETYRGFRPYENLRQIIAQVLIAQPDAVVLNGDAARLDGQTDDYAQLKELLSPVAQRAPIGIGLGNHDDRENFREVFRGANGADGTNADFQLQEGTDKHVLEMEHPWVRLLVLDSLLYVNQVAGLLGKSQRQWLSQRLAEADARPTVLFVHHTLGDADGELLDADRLFGIVEPYAQVKAVFYGHSHRYQIDRRGRLHLVNLPACGYNFGDDQPVGWVDARFRANGCDLTLHAVGGNADRDGQTITLAWND